MDRTWRTAYERLTVVTWARVETRLAGKSRRPLR